MSISWKVNIERVAVYLVRTNGLERHTKIRSTSYLINEDIFYLNQYNVTFGAKRMTFNRVCGLMVFLESDLIFLVGKFISRR